MRKHSVRKWIHAILDMLPLVLIPVFAIYSHRHDLTERTTVDIEYKYQSNDVNNLDDLIVGNVYHLDELTITNDVAVDYTIIDILSLASFDGVDFGDYYIDEIYFSDYLSNTSNALEFSFDTNNDEYGFYFTNLDAYVFLLNNSSYNEITFHNLDFRVVDNSYLFNFKSYLSAYDRSIIPQRSSFNVIENVIVEDTNSDIMSVFMNDLEHGVDKYFNFNKVGNFQDIYDWFVDNLLGGTAPVSFFIVWNIILYEFIMDLIFLTYMLFMFIIDFAEHLIDCFFDKSYRGGR